MNYKTLYLTLAVVGATVPYVFFIVWTHDNSLDFGLFLNAAFSNDVATGLITDLLISSFVFWIAMIEVWRSDRGPAPWPFIVINLVVGLSFALPLYLFVRHMTRPSHSV